MVYIRATNELDKVLALGSHLIDTRIICIISQHEMDIRLNGIAPIGPLEKMLVEEGYDTGTNLHVAEKILLEKQEKLQIDLDEILDKLIDVSWLKNPTTKELI